MTVEIPAEFQQFVHSVIDSGGYKSEAEVVTSALALLRTHAQRPGPATLSMGSENGTNGVPAEVRETAARLGVAQYWQQVVDLTRRVYGGFSAIEVAYDPEIPDDVHIVFTVPARGSVDEALDKDEEWARGLRQIVPRCPRVFLTQLDFGK